MIINLMASFLKTIQDGFRWDYLSRMNEFDVPNFSHFVSTGVKAEYVQPIFPSISMPAYTSIVTGKD